MWRVKDPNYGGLAKIKPKCVLTLFTRQFSRIFLMKFCCFLDFQIGNSWCNLSIMIQISVCWFYCFLGQKVHFTLCTFDHVCPLFYSIFYVDYRFYHLSFIVDQIPFSSHNVSYRPCIRGFPLKKKDLLGWFVHILVF